MLKYLLALWPATWLCNIGKHNWKAYKHAGGHSFIETSYYCKRLGCSERKVDTRFWESLS